MLQGGHERLTDRQTDRQTDRRTDGQTDRVNPIYPPNFVAGGIINQHWYQQGLSAKLATNHYLNQLWTSPLTHICITRIQWSIHMTHKQFDHSMVFFPNKIWGLFCEFKVGSISNFVLQWNLYKAITRCCGLSRQVVFHDREIEHNFVKTVPGKLQNLFF